MSSFGHQLMAVNVDAQLLSILLSQLQSSLDTFHQTNSNSNSNGNGGGSQLLFTSTEDQSALLEIMYYITSFCGEKSATPGMKALGLTLPSSIESGDKTSTLYAFLACCYVCLKWSALKLRSISSLEGKAFLFGNILIMFVHSFILFAYRLECIPAGTNAGRN